MTRKPFDPSENVPVGEYSPLYGKRASPQIYPRPITPRENGLLYFNHKKPYWIPLWGLDMHPFCLRLNPDHVAVHLVADGEPPYEYQSNVMTGWFGVEWEFVPQVNGATVKPGQPKVPDITEWEKYIQMPNLDEMDWEGSAERNREHFANSDRLRIIRCTCGLWERLISLMDVENAAVALIDEEQQEGVHRFLSALCDVYEDMIDRYASHFDFEILQMHDDWGTNRAPFFSLDTCREMILPYLKRVVDACHRNGLLFELHCCGKNEMLVPAMIEAGVDMWFGQGLNDYAMLSEKYPDSCITFGLIPPAVPEDADEEEIARIAHELVETYKDRRVVFNTGETDPRLVAKLYEESRKYFAQFDD